MVLEIKDIKNLRFLRHKNLRNFEVNKMAKCSLCGKKIKPYFDVCFDCYQNTSPESFQFPEMIVRAKFMKEMGIV